MTFDDELDQQWDDASSTISSLIPSVAKAHRRRAGSLLKDVGLAAGQEFVLMLLWDKSPQAQADLTKRLAVEPPTTAKALARLETLGLVSRERSTSDGRVVLVTLTDQGRALEAPVLSIWNTLEAETTSALTVNEQRQLRALLERVHGSLTDPA
jgi:DNA-binding MarR family transcriptional regulator